VVVVIHEIFGLTDWIRSVADQLAADGFIAIAPDLLSGKGPGGGGTSSLDGQGVGQAIRDLPRDEVNRRLEATAGYAMALPAAAPRVGSVGFCWGGTSSFELAVAYPELDAAVVYYGTSPATVSLAPIQAPILGLYGGNDNRVNSTIPAARDELARLEKPYEPVVFEGAGHGFLRAQDGQEGANMEATRQAWPRTVAFFKERLEG
jgi:carboxymethylenebutenolidase